MATSSRTQDLSIRQARAERILDSASELLLRWGYKRVTIDDIAKHAEIGKGTIYLHWKTREELFYAVILREFAVVVAEDFVAAVRRDPWNALLHRMTRAKFLAAMRRPLLRAVIVADLEVLGKLANGRGSAASSRLDVVGTDYLKLLIEAGLIRPELSLEELYYALGTTAGGFFLADAILGKEQPKIALERKADLLADTIRRAFEVDAATEAVRAVAPAVIELLEHTVEICRGVLYAPYEGRKE